MMSNDISLCWAVMNLPECADCRRNPKVMGSKSEWQSYMMPVIRTMSFNGLDDFIVCESYWDKGDN